MADQAFSRGAVLDLLARKYGGSFREADVSLAVQASAIQAAPRDHERVALTFMNLGGTNLYISPKATVSTTAGLRLIPAGGGFTFNADDDGLLTAIEWFVIGDAPGGTLYVLSARREASY